jgi:hypothetical protein
MPADKELIEAAELVASEFASAHPLIIRLRAAVDVARLEALTRPGHHEAEARADRVRDSEYAAGLRAGWNYAQRDDSDGLNADIERRVVGHKAAIQEAAEKDRLTRPLEGVEALARLRQAAAPFAAHYAKWMDAHPDDTRSYAYPVHTIGQIRALIAALSPSPEASGQLSRNPGELNATPNHVGDANGMVSTSPEAQPEPVAWRYRVMGVDKHWTYGTKAEAHGWTHPERWEIQPLYLAPSCDTGKIGREEVARIIYERRFDPWTVDSANEMADAILSLLSGRVGTDHG